MKPVVKRGNSNLLPIGLHLVEIIDFDMQRTESGQLAMKGNVPKGLRVQFKEVNGERVRTKNFPLAENMVWLLESFSKAIDVDLLGSKTYHKSEIIGKKLYIMVIVVRMTRNQIPITEVGINGRVSHQQYYEVGSRFFKYDGVADPCPLGEPNINNPTGWYLQLRELK